MGRLLTSRDVSKEGGPSLEAGLGDGHGPVPDRLQGQPHQIPQTDREGGQERGGRPEQLQGPQERRRPKQCVKRVVGRYL